jgi:ketosteroid isomerase-like protein
MHDEEAVRDLDRAWNAAYVRNDRSQFSHILADDFVATTWDGKMISKAELMSGGEPALVTFSEFAIHTFGPTAITRGRIRVERDRDSFEQRFVRIYSKRNERWQAVAVQVFPIA